MPTPFVVTVDTEEEWDWSSGYPTGPTQTRNIPFLPDFHTVCERHGAAVTYFVNHAVLVDPADREVILQLSRRRRVEIGMHIHPWNTPPLQAVEKVATRESFLHNLDYLAAGPFLCTHPKLAENLRERKALAPR